MTQPSLAQVRAYIGVPATAFPDEDLQRVYNLADFEQRARCNIPVDEAGNEAYPDALGQAFLRRIQREVSAKNLPLGMVGIDAAEYGPMKLPFIDTLVEENERAFRKQVLA